MIEMALNQRFTWRQKTGQTDTGSALYADPVEIYGRCSYKLRQLVTSSGRMVQSRAQITTLAPVAIDDRLTVDGREWPVLAVETPVCFDGRIHHRKVVV